MIDAIRLRVTNLPRSVDFYQTHLGMSRVTLFPESGTAFLKYPNSPLCTGILLEQRRNNEPALSVASPQDVTQGYSHLTIAVLEVELAYYRLNQLGHELLPCIEPSQRNLLDPDGHCIRLMEYDAISTKGKAEPWEHASVQRVSLRVRDPQQSLQFYRRTLGFNLLSEQSSSQHGATHYLVGYPESRQGVRSPAEVTLTSTVLELQHIWKGEDEPNFEYRVDASCGFVGLRVYESFLAPLKARLHSEGMGIIDTASGIVFHDPEGYPWQIEAHSIASTSP